MSMSNTNADVHTNSNETRRSAILTGIGRIAMTVASIALPIVAVIVLLLVGAVLYTSIRHLGAETLIVNPAAATLTAASVTGVLGLLVVSIAALAMTGKRRTLLIAGLFAVAWLALAVLMAILDAAISQGRIQIPDDLLMIGTFVYSALPALPVIPLVALAASAAHERDGQYATLKDASGAMGLTMLKAFSWVAMFAIESYYGVTIGVAPIAAVFAALLNATAFTSALGNIETSSREGDRGGVRMWGLISTFYAVVMFSVAAEAIITFSGGRDGALKAMNPPAWLEAFAQWAFVSSIGLSALLIALTFWRDASRKLVSPTPSSSDDVVTIKRPENRVAGAIRSARVNAGEISDAVRGRSVKALPAGDGQPIATLAKDGEAQVMESATEPAELVGIAKPGDTKVAEVGRSASKAGGESGKA